MVSLVLMYSLFIYSIEYLSKLTDRLLVRAGWLDIALRMSLREKKYIA